MAEGWHEPWTLASIPKLRTYMCIDIIQDLGQYVHVSVQTDGARFDKWPFSTIEWALNITGQ